MLDEVTAAFSRAITTTAYLYFTSLPRSEMFDSSSGHVIHVYHLTRCVLRNLFFIIYRRRTGRDVSNSNYSEFRLGKWLKTLIILPIISLSIYVSNYNRKAPPLERLASWWYTKDVRRDEGNREENDLNRSIGGRRVVSQLIATFFGSSLVARKTNSPHEKTTTRCGRRDVYIWYSFLVNSPKSNRIQETLSINSRDKRFTIGRCALVFIRV